MFSVKADPIINHHRLGTTPIVPLVAYLEIGAEVHSLVFGKSEQYCFKDVMIYKPLKLFNEKSQELIMKIDEAPDKSINAALYNYFKPKIGDGRMMEIAELKISNKLGEYEYLNEIKDIENAGMKEVLLYESLERMRKIHSNAIQLGPLFMDEKSAKINKYKCNDYGVVLTVALSEEQIRNKKYDLPNLLFNPAFADTLMQSCGVHAAEGSDRVYLPSEIGEFGLVQVPKEPGLFKSYAKLIRSSDEEKIYNVILYNDRGEVCYYAKDVIVRRISQ
ncbi:MAG TPA: polyketide synthase dehydratase domain-containing protein [Acetivibrio clariflavus]|nr:polyketide synthase dehydratase domain-containing protein [Acetivibrio clariflavus]